MAKAIAKTSAAFPINTLPDPEPANISRDQITGLMMESHKKAANTMEEIAALREIAKLNDLYPGTNTKVDVSVTHVEQSVKELEKMSTEKLLELAGEKADLLDLPEPIEGEFEEVEDKEGEGETLGKTPVMPLEDVT